MPSFSDDSRTLYLHRHEPESHTVNLTRLPLNLTSSRAHIPLSGEWRQRTRIENGRTLGAREWGGQQQRAILVDLSGDQPVVGGTVSCTASAGFVDFFWSASGKAVYRSKEGQLRRVEIKDAKFVNDRELTIGDGKGTPKGISANGQRVVLRAGDLFELWDIAGESPRKTMELRYNGGAIALSADGRWMTTTHSETKLWRIDGSEPQFVGWLDQTGNAGTGSVAFSQDGNRAIVGSDNGFVRFWDLSSDTPKELSPPNLAQAFRRPGYTRPQLDPRTGQLMLHTYDAPKAGFRPRFQLWDFAASAPRPYPAPDAALNSNIEGAIFPLSEAQWLNVNFWGSHETNSIRDGVWQSVGKPFGEQSPLSTVSPDGAWLFAFSDAKPGEYTIEGWDMRQEPVRKWTMPFDEAKELKGGAIHSSHDGSLFAVAHGDGNGGKLTLFRHHGDRAEKFGAIPFKSNIGLSRAALSPDGDWLVHYSESNLGPVVIANIRTGQAQELTRTKLGAVRWLTFSPDGQRVAYASDIGSLIGRVGVLDAKTLAPLYEWKSPGFVEWLDFAPDARHLITLNGNHTVYVLRLPPSVTGQ